MQQLPNGNKSPRTAQDCAQALLALAPQMMQRLRQGMRSGRGPDLSVPQFRVLVHCHLHPGAPLSRLAEHMGLSTPSASRLVEGLVARRLITRETVAADRRCVAIALTEAGRRILDKAHADALALFAGDLAGLDRQELAGLKAALALLQRVFHPDLRAGVHAGIHADQADADHVATWPAQAALADKALTRRHK